MNFIKTKIKGVMSVEPRILADQRGYFFESYNFVRNGIPNRLKDLLQHV